MGGASVAPRNFSMPSGAGWTFQLPEPFVRFLYHFCTFTWAQDINTAGSTKYRPVSALLEGQESRDSKSVDSTLLPLDSFLHHVIWCMWNSAIASPSFPLLPTRQSWQMERERERESMGSGHFGAPKFSGESSGLTLAMIFFWVHVPRAFKRDELSIRP